MLFAEAFRSLRASASTTLAATMTVLIGMFLLGLFIALGTWVVSWSDHVKKEVIVKVYFCTPMSCGYEATPAQINAVAAKLNADPHVKTFDFVSEQEALKRMRKRLPEVFKVGLPSNPFPASEEVEPKRAEYADAIYKSFTPRPKGVETVNYGQKTAKRIISVAKVIESIFLLAIVILLVASTLLIANTIRLSIFSRRREIEVMKLVGATNWFVRGPFMLEGLITGAVGSLLAVILLLLGKELALPRILGHINGGSDVSAIPFSLNALALVLVGLLLGAAGSGLTLRRFLRV
ncbi:MAG TPA: permease-like cell division protein FtsX [Gaiellaceae bacterium]